MARQTTPAPLARRFLVAFAFAAAMLPAAPLPADADHTPDHESIARLQVILKRIHVEDDEDWFGEGEINGQIWMNRCNHALEKCPIVGSPYGLALDFNADSGDEKVFDRLLPGSEDTGFPVYPGDWFRISMTLKEEDATDGHTIALDGDDMGDVNFTFSEADNWRLGTPFIGWSTNSDYWVEFEIRRAPVPDISPVGIKTLKLPGTTDDTVCVAVVNREVPQSGPFKVTLRVNGVIPTGGVMEAGGLPGGQPGELCVLTKLPSSAELMATVDEARQLVEFSEANNRLAQPYTAPQGANAPAAGPMQARLRAQGISVKSAEPGGSQDCDPGKNDVTVAVRNDGSAESSAFAVRLIVDGEDKETNEKSVDKLEAGKELDVTFDDVRLKQGMRDLKARLVAKTAADQVDQDNDEANISVNCRSS